MKIILILCIILFIFSLLFIFYNNIKKIYRKKVVDLSFWRNKYQNHHKELLEFVKKVIPYLEKWKITYWCHAGTLLGYVRHKGFIPWDDDVDFGYIDDNRNINNLIIDLEKNNFQINRYIYFGFKIVEKNNNNIFIDMFEFTCINNMLYQTKEAQKKFPKENYYNNEVFPIKTGYFNNIKLSIPNKPKKFCNRAFPYYNEVFYVQRPHNKKSIIEYIENIIFYLYRKEKFYIKDLIN